MTAIGVIILLTQILPSLGYNPKEDLEYVNQFKPQAEEIILQNILKDVEGIDFVYLDDGDVVRHKLVKDIINAYDRYIPEEASPVSVKRSSSKKSSD